MQSPFLCKAAELQLGDTVDLFDSGPFGSAVVTQIKDGFVHVFRPYCVTTDFSYTGGVIPYIGTETMVFQVDIEREFRVWHRKEIK